MRVRGLKPDEIETDIVVGDVAPHAGAWIETEDDGIKTDGGGVAPHAGAWIETCISFHTPLSLQGRTPCGCVD